jgi:hypothetical protein
MIGVLNHHRLQVTTPEDQHPVEQLAAIAPGRILPSQPQNQAAHLGSDPWPVASTRISAHTDRRALPGHERNTGSGAVGHGVVTLRDRQDSFLAPGQVSGRLRRGRSDRASGSGDARPDVGQAFPPHRDWDCSSRTREHRHGPVGPPLFGGHGALGLTRLSPCPAQRRQDASHRSFGGSLRCRVEAPLFMRLRALSAANSATESP